MAETKIDYSQVGTATPIGVEVAYAGRTAPDGWLLEYGQAISRVAYSLLFSVISPSIGTFSITIASPGVITLNGHGLVTGDQLYLTTTGALPTGVTPNTLYYAIFVTSNTIRLATTRANAVANTAINTSGTQSGVHTMWFCPYGLGDGSTTFNVPDRRGRVAAGNDSMGGTSANRLTNPSSTIGGIDGDNMGGSGGAETHVITVAQLASHTHTKGPSGTSGTFGLVDSGAASSSGNPPTGSTGSDAAHNNVQPTLISNYIIKAL